ncbi:MAG: hypothetical protein ACRDS1_02250 [Pseudonocardiaceae bacterium]
MPDLPDCRRNPGVDGKIPPPPGYVHVIVGRHQARVEVHLS